jgi:hypothetical protein
MLSGIEDLKINLTENLSREKYVEGIKHELTLASRLTSTFNSLGTKIISKASKFSIKFNTSHW